MELTGSRLGGYVLGGRIGAGGMEARIASLVEHPNVVQVFDLGCDRGQYFIAMELVRGVSLAALADALRVRGKRLSADLVTYIGRQLCDALQYAHELTDAEGNPLHLIHRDITPHNVLLSVDGRVKLTDFGIAKSRDVTVSSTGSCVARRPVMSERTSETSTSSLIALLRPT